MGAVMKLPTDQVTPGMMLAEDVVAHGGSLLLPAGTTLSQEQIDRLGQRGIETMSIVGAAEESSDGAELEARRQAERQRVLHLFRRDAGDPLMQALLRTVLEYRLEKIR